MRRGFGTAALVAAALAISGGVGVAEGPVYDEGPVYSPAEPVAGAPPPRLRFAGLKRNRSNGRAVLFVRVSEPGRLFLWGRGALPFRRATDRAGRVRLLIRPRIPLKRHLRRRGKGRIRINVAFEPFSGAVGKTFERPVLLKRKRRR